MEVEGNVIKDDSSRGRIRGIAGQHHHKGGTKSHGTPVNTGNTVTVKVGLNMNICRLCLTEGTVNSRLQPVFYSKDTPDEPLLQKILDLTTIQVQYASDFPSSICINCKVKLEEYSHFRRQCIENDELLRMKYYEIKAAEDYHLQQQQQQQQHQQQQQQQQLHRSQAIEQEIVEEVKAEEYIDDADDITLAIDESADADEEFQDESDEQHQQQQQGQVVEQQTIQYVAADGTMTEYVESSDVRTVSSSSQQQQIHISGYSEGETIQAGEAHEIYYTDGNDTYAIQTTAEGYVNAANYVPQGYDNQTEIECTTIEHLPEEEVYMDEGGEGAVGNAITPRGAHDRPFVCKHCKTSFKYEYNYERHMKNHAKVLYRCGKCSKTFTKQRKCQQHFLKAHSSQRYECDICFRTYSLPTRLENHVIEMHSENGIYKCDRCTETFTSYLDFKSHRNSHHSINGSSNAAAATVIAQTVEQRPQTIQQVQSPQPHIAAPHTNTSISTRSSVSDNCDFEVMIDETKIPKPATGAESGDEKRPTQQEQDIILIDDEAASVNNNSKPVAATTTVVVSTASNSVISGGKIVTSTQAGPVVPSSTIAAAQPIVSSVPQLQPSLPATTTATTTTVITNGIDKNSMHRQLLQQIEESEANSTGPKIYKCDSCTKNFVHLNNLKAHIYAEHDNDKPFKCKLCPISFKTKEILVMHMVLHSQHNTAT